ncbi:MAG: ABC transporter ATP-binding protein NatA [Verrucomicrobia subdivision 3 bacterium]|nr:ABC transporter ATP-binding protein NatA [Limisphaerales bacterium]MCS1412938.1 ABC transporter ATP-binding protein NatA [Limisphaerales bacterium]
MEKTDATESRSVESPAVETTKLTRRYGTMTALSSLSLRVERGDLFGFIGSNGAGKTTTLRILATFLTPSEGYAKVLGHDVVRDADSVRHMIGYMPDFFGVYKDMEVTEYLDFFGACYKIPTKQRETTVKDVLELVGLTEKQGALIGALSRGMQQRLGLARVLIHDPKLLLLDEPASGLDPRARIEMMAILQELQRMNKTIIISSHILSELQNLCNRVAIIEKGELIYSGSVTGVADQMKSEVIVWAKVATDSAAAIAALKRRSEIADAEEAEGRIRVTMSPSAADISCVAEILVHSGAKLTELREDTLGLEEVFLRVTKGETQ